jgi:hypothetical protein
LPAALHVEQVAMARLPRRSLCDASAVQAGVPLRPPTVLPACASRSGSAHPCCQCVEHRVQRQLRGLDLASGAPCGHRSHGLWLPTTARASHVSSLAWATSVVLQQDCQPALRGHGPRICCGHLQSQTTFLGAPHDIAAGASSERPVHSSDDGHRKHPPPTAITSLRVQQEFH